MKLIKVKIKPKSSFITFPKGDIVFGHFAYHTFFDTQQSLKNYLDEKPKIIFSDFLPDSYLPKPSLMLKCFGLKEEDRKDFSKKEWISIENLQKGNLKECEKLDFFKNTITVRNSLNRLTFTTDNSKEFAPYSLDEKTFVHQPVLYILYDQDTFTQEYILEILNKIGEVGFGEKGSIGKGSFTAKVDENFSDFQKNVKSNYYLTISPTFLHNQKGTILSAYYDLFTRFGKFHSTSTPFKKTVLLADSGAVIELKKDSQYIGKAINNGTKNKISFIQGYSIVIPFTFEASCLGENNELNQ